MKRWIDAMGFYHDIKGEFFEEMVCNRNSFIEKLTGLEETEKSKEISDIIFSLIYTEFMTEKEFEKLFKFYVRRFWKIDKKGEDILESFINSENYSVMFEKYNNLNGVMDYFLVDIRKNFSNNAYYQKNYRNFEIENFRINKTWLKPFGEEKKYG